MSTEHPKWHTMEIGNIQDYLKTHVDSGLTPEDIKSGRRPTNKKIFVFPELSKRNAAAMVLSDVALIFFAIVAIFFACTGRWLEALLSVIFVGINCVLTVYLKISANKYENAVTAPSIPRCTVLRDGKFQSLDARDVMLGDIVKLRMGDIAPCDIRISRSKNFKVMDIVGINDKGEIKYGMLSKNSERMDAVGAVAFDKITNMVFAGATVMSGIAEGIAVECGRSTFIGRNFGGIKLKNENSSGPVQNVIDNLFRYISMGLGIIIIPFVFISLFAKNSVATPIDFLAGTAALALSLPLQTITVLFSTVISAAVRKCGKGSPETDRAIIKNYGRVVNLTNADKILILDKESVNARGLCFESIYSNMKSVVTFDDERTKDHTVLLEHAYAITKAAESLSAANMTVGNYSEHYLYYISKFGNDAEKVKGSTGFLSHHNLTRENASDCAIVTSGDQFGKSSILICRSLDTSIIDCAAWYTSSGVAVTIDGIIRDNIKEEYRRLKSLGFQVISIASAPASFYDEERFSSYASDLVFEGMIAVGPVYSYKCADSAKELYDLGISPVVCLPEEGENSEYIVLNVFRKIKKNPVIVRASELSASGQSILDFPDADAYIGFQSSAPITDLIRESRKRGTVFASVAVSCYDLPIALESDYSVAYSYDKLDERACTQSYPPTPNDHGASASALKKQADLIVAPVSKAGGGLDGVLSAVKCMRSFFRNLEAAMTYMLSSVAARAVAVYIPLLFGRPSMNSSMLLFLGCVVDLLALLSVSLRTNVKPKEKGSRIWENPLDILKTNVKPILLSVLNGITVAVAGLMIPKDNVGELQSYTFLALLMIQAIWLGFVLFSKTDENDQKLFKTVVLPILILVIISTVLGLIPFVGASLGFAGGIMAYVRAAVVALIAVTVAYFFHFKTDI